MNDVNLCPVSPNHRPWISDDVVNIGQPCTFSSLTLRRKNVRQSIALTGIGRYNAVTTIMPSVGYGGYPPVDPSGE